MRLAVAKSQTGFTLIEIAIVLVIVGLLLGGVLKGQELIEQAKIKNVINDINGTTAAFYSYQDRYVALPGDDPNALARWPAGALGAGAATSGNGDGIVLGAFETGAVGAEVRLFWQHLRLAGFAKGSLATAALSQTPPINKFNGRLGVQTTAMGISGLLICESNLPAKTAEAVDTQLDDGGGFTGALVASLGAGTVALPAAAPTATYIDTGNNFYTVCQAM